MSRLTLLILVALSFWAVIPAFATDDGSDYGQNQDRGVVYILPRPVATVNGCQFRYAATYYAWVQRKEVLGNPVSNEQVGNRSPQGTDATFMLFERGTINHILNGAGKGRSWVVLGGIGEKYRDFRGPAGFLGYPTSHEYNFNAAGHDAQSFEGGMIYWDDRSTNFAVSEK